MNSPIIDSPKQTFLSVALSRSIVFRAIKIAVIVGTILAFINHGEKVMSLSLSGEDWLKVFLTYLVPYCVSTWSATGAVRAKAL